MFARFLYIFIFMINQISSASQEIISKARLSPSSLDKDVYLDNFIQHVEPLSVQQWSISFWIKTQSSQPSNTQRTLLQLIDRQDNRSLLDLSLYFQTINHELTISKDKNSSITSCSGISFINSALTNDFDKRVISDLMPWTFLVLGFDIDISSLPASSFSLMKNAVEVCNQIPLHTIIKKDLLLRIKSNTDLTLLLFDMKIHDSYYGIGDITNQFVYGEAVMTGLYKFHLYPQYLDRPFNLLDNGVDGLVYKNLMPQGSTYYFHPSKTNTWFTRNLSIFETHLHVPQEHMKSSPIDNSYILTVDFDCIIRGFNLNYHIDNSIFLIDPFRYIYFMRAPNTFRKYEDLHTT